MPSYDNLDAYLDVLAKAVSQPYPPYEAIGTQRDGEWVQINTNVLQIENEFYSTIRPKRVTHPGERPLHALAARGVQYIEVRCLDIDPFEPTGISLETSRFLDAYLLYCALDDSPLLPVDASAEANDNFSRVTKEGRKPGLDVVARRTRRADAGLGRRIARPDRAGREGARRARTAPMSTCTRSRPSGRDSRTYR